MNSFSLAQMFDDLLHRPNQSRAARSVEWFGWLMLLESLAVLFVPQAVADLLAIGPLSAQALIYFRVGGLLIGGLGMLYVISGRLTANGFIFASMLDRPLVPPIMLLLWLLGIVPGSLAALFAVTDLGTFLWTVSAWRADQRAALPRPAAG